MRSATAREIVFDILSEPYLGRQTRAVADKIYVLERGSDMVLAAHRTPVRGGLVATTLESVRFTRPDRVDFRLIRGPVACVVEAFDLDEHAAGTRLSYTGEFGTALWSLGPCWGNVVAKPWEHAVRETFAAVREKPNAAPATHARDPIAASQWRREGEPLQLMGCY